LKSWSLNTSLLVIQYSPKLCSFASFRIDVVARLMSLATYRSCHFSSQVDKVNEFSVTPAENGVPGIVCESSYRMCTFFKVISKLSMIFVVSCCTRVALVFLLLLLWL
jgi:hypothetical protein